MTLPQLILGDRLYGVAEQVDLSETLSVGSKAKSHLSDQLTPRLTHGGNPSLRKRKTARPYSPRSPVQLVLQTKRAKGNWSLLHRKNQAKIQRMVYTYGERFKVRVYQFANTGNHLHLLVKAEDRKNLADFLRVLAGRIAVVVTGAEKGKKRIGKFWDYLTWSKLVNWGSEFFGVRKFILETRLSPNERPNSLSLGDIQTSGPPEEEWGFP